MKARDAKYFRETETLSDPHYRNLKDAAAIGPLNHLARYGQAPCGRNGRGELVLADRIIFYKLRPSLHKCDARCMNAKGHNCECSCGGANHGINA